MWIIPKSITCRFAPGTEALTSDCGDASRVCGQSLMLRSKPSRASSFLRGWKAGNLMRLRSGLISSHSRGESFADWWTSSLAATRASHSPAQANVLEEKTRDTSGRLSQAAFDFFNLESASLRTSRATLPKGCTTSCLTWEDWVIEQRGEFSARLSAARLISGSESLSWPTATARDYRDTGDLSGSDYRADGKLRKDVLPRAVDLDRRGFYGRPAPANRNLDGSRQESWPTPVKTDGEINQNLARWRERQAIKAERGIDLQRPLMIAVAQEIEKQAQSWATPEAKNQVGYQVGTDGTKWPRLGSQVSGKLNPRWVETLMGLPVGWTMPSCPSPVTIAPMSCVSSATESCQQLPSLPS